MRVGRRGERERKKGWRGLWGVGGGEVGEAAYASESLNHGCPAAMGISHSDAGTPGG